MSLVLFLNLVILEQTFKNLSYLEYMEHQSEKVNLSILIYLRNSSQIINFVDFLKNCHFFNYYQFIDLFAVDFLKLHLFRFELIYVLRTYFDFSKNIFLYVGVSDIMVISSLESLYKGVIWTQREIYDLFGLWFSNAIDLRRILTDYGFKGYPLRKDFPITGYSEVFYSNVHKRVMWSFIKLSQNYRLFLNLSSCWYD
jgi:NADH-quinone oxidoreductase subunit C